jgi:hypothetical protein
MPKWGYSIIQETLNRKNSESQRKRTKGIHKAAREVCRAVRVYA